LTTNPQAKKKKKKKKNVAFNTTEDNEPLRRPLSFVTSSTIRGFNSLQGLSMKDLTGDDDSFGVAVRSGPSPLWVSFIFVQATKTPAANRGMLHEQDTTCCSGPEARSSARFLARSRNLVVTDCFTTEPSVETPTDSVVSATSASSPICRFYRALNPGCETRRNETFDEARTF